MYGTLAGALAGRKIAFDRTAFTATVDGRIVGVGRTIKIEAIAVHYRVSVPAEAREAAERAIAVHAQGCPAHESVKGTIAVTWDAVLTAGSETITLRSDHATA